MLKNVIALESDLLEEIESDEEKNDFAVMNFSDDEDDTDYEDSDDHEDTDEEDEE